MSDESASVEAPEGSQWSFSNNPPDQLERFLGLAIRGRRSYDEEQELRRLYARIGAANALKLSHANRVGALVANTLLELGVESASGREWQDLVEANGHRVRALTAAAASVSARLDDAGVLAAVVEGGGVMLGTQLPEQAFCPGDLDFLVAADREREVTLAFTREGFTPVHRIGRHSSVRTEYRKASESGELWLAAGTVPFDRAWMPLCIPDHSSEWLGRRLRSTRSNLWVLDPTDALVFVCIHTSLHSFVRAPGIRLHVDVDRLVRDCLIDWTAYLAQVELLGVRRRAWASVALAKAILGTPIPGTVLSTLSPPMPVRVGLSRLIGSAGVLADGRPKLRWGSAVLLDSLVSDQDFQPWLHDLLFPPERWMREHFAGDDQAESSWRLHLRRFSQAAVRWRPR